MKNLVLLIILSITYSCHSSISSPNLPDTLIVWTEKDNYTKRNDVPSDIINMLLYNGYDRKIHYYNPIYALFRKTNNNWEFLRHTDIATPKEIDSKDFAVFKVSLDNLPLFESDTFKYICSYRVQDDSELYTCETNEFIISVHY